MFLTQKKENLIVLSSLNWNPSRKEKGTFLGKSLTKLIKDWMNIQSLWVSGAKDFVRCGQANFAKKFWVNESK